MHEAYDDRRGQAGRVPEGSTAPFSKGLTRTARAAFYSAGAVAVALTFAGPAQAAPIGFSATVAGLYGNNWSGDAQSDPYGLGLGANVGFVLPASIYVGAALRHFFGQDTGETLLSSPPISVERTAQLTELTGHVGYDLDLVAVALRPSLGVGYGLASVEVQSSGIGGETSAASTEGAIVLSPGVEARFPLGLVAGCVELRYEVMFETGDDIAALIIGVGVGLDL